MTADDVTLTEAVTAQDRSDVADWLIREADQRVKFFPQRRDGVDALMRQTARDVRADRLAAVQAEREKAERALAFAVERSTESARVVRVLDARIVELADLAEERANAAQAWRDRAALANPSAEEECTCPANHGVGFTVHKPPCQFANPPALAQHDAEVGARALREAADAIDSGEADHESLRLAGVNEVATYGWSDGSVADAYDSGSVWRDWLRARADALTTDTE